MNKLEFDSNYPEYYGIDKKFGKDLKILSRIIYSYQLTKLYKTITYLVYYK